MDKVFIPARQAEDWKGLLAEPAKQWKTGYSARTLAHCWQEAQGLPEPIGSMMTKAMGPTTMLMAFPEYKVPLPGGGRPSQNDLFVLARSKRGLVTMMVEGKVSEPFDRTVSEWRQEASEGKAERLRYLCTQLRLPEQDVLDVRYQLLHRTVSALIEAGRFCAPAAVMLVHSFSPEHQWFDDYARFAALFGVSAEVDTLAHAATIDGVDLYLGWARGNRTYLAR